MESFTIIHSIFVLYLVELYPAYELTPYFSEFGLSLLAYLEWPMPLVTSVIILVKLNTSFSVRPSLP